MEGPLAGVKVQIQERVFRRPHYPARLNFATYNKKASNHFKFSHTGIITCSNNANSSIRWNILLYNSIMEKSGILESNRRHVEALCRRTNGPFDVHAATGILGMEPDKAKRFLAYLAERGWLTRVRHGAYITVPLEAHDPSQWREDTWVVAHHCFSPGYVGGWSACEHWGFTEQIFRDLVVFTSKAVRHQRPEIQGTRFRLKVVSAKQIFGTKQIWRKQTKVAVSDPSRTIIDILDDPSIGGGISHIAGVLQQYFESPHRDDATLTAYATKRGNRTVFKRLGYLVEELRVDAPELLSNCRRLMSTNHSALDPSVKTRGRIVTRWKLRANVSLPTGNES